MGQSFSKPVDQSLAKKPPKGKRQGETPQETRKGETQGGTPSNRYRTRDTAILLLSFASIISDASDLLKPMKVVCEFIKKILEVAKVSFNLPD